VLVGNTNNEYPDWGGRLNSLSSSIFNCPSHIVANIRIKAGVPAWRYLYAGEFPNLSIGSLYQNLKGAWHGSELGLIFGTAETLDKGLDTANEKKLAKDLRVAWSTFAKDPVHGLEKLGWPVYNPKGDFRHSQAFRLMTDIDDRSYSCGAGWN
jgi:carboxylesterase type B